MFKGFAPVHEENPRRKKSFLIFQSWSAISGPAGFATHAAHAFFTPQQKGRAGMIPGGLLKQLPARSSGSAVMT
jgi:hypothetical protein